MLNLGGLVPAVFGGMCSYSARYLRRLARDASDPGGTDPTDYSLSSTARSFAIAQPSHEPKFDVYRNDVWFMRDGIVNLGGDPDRRSCVQSRRL